MRTHFAPDHRPTIEEALETYCALKLGSADYRPATRSSYSRAIREYLGLCSDLVYADQLDLASVRRYCQDLEQRQLRATSQHLKIAAVKAFISYLERQGVLSTRVSHAIQLPTPERTKPARPVDVDDAAALLREVKQSQQPRDIAVLAVLLHTGILLSELTELTVTDLSLPSALATGRSLNRGNRSTAAPKAAFKWGSLRLRGRAPAQRQEAPLDQATCQALSTYLAARPSSPHPHLFLTTAATPLTVKAALNIIKRHARAAGMPWVHSRALRSGFVLRQLAAGIPLLEVQSRIGHRNITTTRRYTGLLRSSVGGTGMHRRTCGVLIVDERPETRRQLRLLLEDAGHQVFEASDPVGAQDMLRLSRLSLVVLVNLWAPPWHSADLLSDLMQEGHRFSNHRVVLLTPSDQQLPEHVTDTVVVHAIPIIERPIDLARLLTHIAQTYVELGAHGEAPGGLHPTAGS
jgi:site-specific recombinase XerD/CheY-like chemotaxis protein